MIRRVLKVKLTLVGPIMTQATSAGIYGIDAMLARRTDDNGVQRYYLPRSLVKSRLRQSLEELNCCATASSAPLDDWFGKAPLEDWLGKSSAVGDYTPHRSRLHFDDFLGPPALPTSPVHVRIRIDEKTGAVRHGMLQMAECPFTPGEKVEFTGTIGFNASDSDESAKIREMLEIGFRWTPYFGADVGIGFGRLDSVAIEELKPSTTDGGSVFPAAGQSPQSPARVGPLSAILPAKLLGISLNVLDPFCLSRRRVNGNTFESESVISGAALKGTVASALRQDPDTWTSLEMNLHLIRFTHLFPCASEARPTVVPLSLVKAKRNSNDETFQLVDTALMHRPFLVAGKSPAFGVDWKDDSDALQAYGWPHLKREMRVRTQIDREKRRALDEQLFAYEMIVPGATIWRGVIDLSAIGDDTERAKTADLLQDLFSRELDGLGKTKARLRAVCDNQSAVPTAGRFFDHDGAKWCVVVLQTPALLCDPMKVKSGDDGVSLFAEYSAVWKSQKMSDSHLELSHFYARQSLAGGYLTQRFRPRSEPYAPFLLTDAGSVFVFRVVDEAAAQNIVERWATHGLPLPIDRYGDDWRTCPFRPQEGFGEVVVNDPRHQAHLPRNVFGEDLVEEFDRE